MVAKVTKLTMLFTFSCYDSRHIAVYIFELIIAMQYTYVIIIVVIVLIFAYIVCI